MGTHASGPATIIGSDVTLSAWLKDHPEALGAQVIERFGNDLPFLFKVLSVRTALSIQSHPDKQLAEQLHAKNPQMYKDDNHKPEMALALEDFEALCGFVLLEELQQLLTDTPELVAAVGQPHVDAVHAACSPQEAKEALRAAFTSLMTCKQDQIDSAIQQLTTRLGREAATRQLSQKEQLVLRLNAQYPRDVGVLSSMFLNLVSLPAGHAIYLAANEPHAYLSGELVECMATSDNVIRAGLTPKFKDTEVLCRSLTYHQGRPAVLTGEVVHDHIKLYRPPFDEFEVQLVEVPPSETVRMPVNQGPVLLLVQEGSGRAKATSSLCSTAAEMQQATDVHRGSILFVPAAVDISFTAADHPLKIWAAACNRSIFAAALADQTRANGGASVEVARKELLPA